MAYIVFARKYRPQDFKEVINQKHITITLSNAINLNRISHAYLFTGPRGTGKTSIARILAKAINCEEKPTAQPCLVCDNCKEITEGSCLDVIEIDGASNRGIDEIRDLRERIKFASNKCRYKVYIIDEVHMLTTEAFNALLKTLEEPPAHIIFIFATTEPQKVPLTIASRCQEFDFKRLSILDITENLTKICIQEKIEIESNCLDFISQNAEGSIRDGQSILDQVTSYCGERKITLKDVKEILGKIEEEVLWEIAKTIVDQNSTLIINLVEEIITQGKDIVQFTKDLREYFRNLMIWKIKSEIDIDWKKEWKEIFFCFKIEEIIEILSYISQLEQDLKRSSNTRITLELAVIKLSRIKTTVFQQNFLERLEKLEKIINNEEKKIENEIEKNIEENNDIKEVSKEIVFSFNSDNEVNNEEKKEINELVNLKNMWQKIINNLKKTRITTACWLEQGVPISIENDTIIIGFNNSFYKEKIEGKHQEIIEKEIESVMKKKYKIKCEITKTEIAENSKDQKHKDNEKKILKENINEILKKEDMIQKALDLFNGEIIDVVKK
ncbi:MAG: DNA polymerase III subunit gamma/tau [bacterium]